MHIHQAQVKTIGSNGQVSLGKEFAGKMVLVEQIEEGTWVIKCGEFVPDSEKWLYQAKNKAKIERAIDWAEKNPPTDNFDKIIQVLENDVDKD